VLNAFLLPDPDPDQIRVAVGTALGGTLIGWAVGGTTGSIMADYVGRKKMLMISIVGYCAFTAFTALSQSGMMLITGMFLGTEWSTGTALVAETWPASARAKALGFMQSGYGFGFFLAAALYDRNHRAHDASGDEGQGPSCATTKSL
jgi:MFS family permease